MMLFEDGVHHVSISMNVLLVPEEVCMRLCVVSEDDLVIVKVVQIGFKVRNSCFIVT